MAHVCNPCSLEADICELQASMFYTVPHQQGLHSKTFSQTKPNTLQDPAHPTHSCGLLKRVLPKPTLLKGFILLYVHECFACMHMCTRVCACQIPWTGVTNGWESPCEHWGPNLCPPQEQVLFTTPPCLPGKCRINSCCLSSFPGCTWHQSSVWLHFRNNLGWKRWLSRWKCLQRRPDDLSSELQTACKKPGYLLISAY